MRQDELLGHVVRVLEGLGLPYFVTGSMASMYYGEPRFTNDIDVVLDLPSDRIPDFCGEFPSTDFYLDEEAVRSAVKHHGQFSILHPTGGLEVDIVVPEESLFNRHRFQRARRIRVSEDCEAHFSSPEDVILMKMRFFHEGRSDKHLRDIAGILKVAGERLDSTTFRTGPIS